MLDAEMKAQVGAYLERLVTDVEITAYVDDSQGTTDMRALLADIASVSSRVTVQESRDTGMRAPSFAIARPGEPARVTFAGLPMGHEFTSLILALLQVGGYPPKVEPSLIDQIEALDGDFEFVTYISLSCQNCPDVVQALT